MLPGTDVECLQDPLNKNAAVEDGKTGHCSGSAQKKKADHSIEGQGNQQKAQKEPG